MALDTESCKTEYNSLRDNSVDEKKRQPTDVIFTYVSGTFIVIWLIFGIYVLNTAVAIRDVDAVVGESMNHSITNISEILHLTYNLIASHSGAYVGCIAVTVSLAIVYMIMLRGVMAKILNYLIIFGTVCFICLIIGLMILTITVTIGSGNISSTIFVLTFCLIFCIYKISVLYSINKVGVRLITEYINESCRIIFNQYQTILFSFAIYSLLLLITVFTVLVVDSILETEFSAFCTIFAIIINICGASFIYSFIIYFKQMVIADCIAKWYWTVDKKTVSKTQALNSSARILRNHSGTIGFGSTFLLPVIQAAYVACTSKKENPMKSTENRFIRFICKTELILSIPNYSLIQTSIYGTNFIQSTRKTFNLVLPNSLRFLAIMDMASNHIFTISTIIVTVITIIVAGSITGIQSTDPALRIATQFIVLSILTVLLPFLLVLYTSINTLLFCTLKDLEENNGSTEKPYFMNYELQRILTNTL